MALSRFFSYPLFTLWRRFFGLLLSGTAGTAFYLVLAMIWVYCAWALYRLDRRGGWIALGVMILFRLSSVVTYSRYNLGDIYSAMGSFSGATGCEAAIAGLSGCTLMWSTVILFPPFLAHLIYIRRFFPTR